MAECATIEKNLMNSNVTHRNARHSGLELLRLLSMFFILALHVNFYAFGAPSLLDFRASPFGSTIRVFLESATIVGVNCFILISGWFGIRPKTKRVAELLFQCAFFCLLLYGFGLIAGIPFGRREALKNLFLVGKLNWFIKAYLVLYILAPVLEAFVSTASRRQFATVVVSFFAFQTIYGWLFPVATFFNGGYSAISFVGIYLLSRFIRQFRPHFSNFPPCADFLAYVLLALTTTGMHVLNTLENSALSVNWFAYCSPLVIASSLFLFLFFSKQRFQARAIDTMARSSYAAYLFHVHPCICAPLLIPSAQLILTFAPFCQILLMPILLAIFFAGAILCDQVRILAWTRIVHRISP